MKTSVAILAQVGAPLPRGRGLPQLGPMSVAAGLETCGAAAACPARRVVCSSIAMVGHSAWGSGHCVRRAACMESMEPAASPSTLVGQWLRQLLRQGLEALEHFCNRSKQANGEAYPGCGVPLSFIPPPQLDDVFALHEPATVGKQETRIQATGKVAIHGLSSHRAAATTERPDGSQEWVIKERGCTTLSIHAPAEGNKVSATYYSVATQMTWRGTPSTDLGSAAASLQPPGSSGALWNSLDVRGGTCCMVRRSPASSSRCFLPCPASYLGCGEPEPCTEPGDGAHSFAKLRTPRCAPVPLTSLESAATMALPHWGLLRGQSSHPACPYCESKAARVLHPAMLGVSSLNWAA